MSKDAMLQAARRAQELTDMDYVVVDVETTGFNGQRDRIVQIGIVNANGDALLDMLVNPGVPIPNSHIHGITDAMVKDAPKFSDVHPYLIQQLNKKTVLAYNWAFDGSFIRGNSQQFGLLPPPGMKGACIMELFAQFYGEWNARYKSYRWQKLATAAAHFDVTVDGRAHSALADAQMARLVLKGMAARADAERK